MRTYIFTMLIAVLVLTACGQGHENSSAQSNVIEENTPTDAPATTEVSRMLEGEWSYECDPLDFNRFSWKSTIEIEYVGQMAVEINFDDLDIIINEEYQSTLAFKVYAIQPEYKYDRLWVNKDGTFDAEIEYFSTIGVMEEYPGGYEAFKGELESLEIDWSNMYLKAKAEFLLQYQHMLMNDELCIPDFEAILPTKEAPMPSA